MKNIIFKNVQALFFTLIFFCISCTVKDPNIPEKSLSMNPQTQPGTMPPVEIKLLQGMSAKDLDDMMKLEENKEQLKNFMLLSMDIPKSSSWEVAHKQAVPFLESVQGKMLEFFFVQQIAHFMLRQHLLNGNPEITQEKRSAIEFYTRGLVKYKSYSDRVLIAQTLTVLRDQWQPTELKTIAKECLEFGSVKPSQTLDINKIKQMSPEERQSFFVKEMVQKQNINQTEAIKHAAIMEKMYQERSKNTNATQFQHPKQLPPEILKQEQALKTLAEFAGEKFTSYEDRMRAENQK